MSDKKETLRSAILKYVGGSDADQALYEFRWNVRELSQDQLFEPWGRELQQATSYIDAAMLLLDNAKETVKERVRSLSLAELEGLHQRLVVVEDEKVA